MGSRTFRLLGAEPTPIAMGELYTALQLGTVDGQENPTSHALNSKLYEVQKYLSITHHQHVFSPLIMNKAKFDSLPTDIQKVLRETAQEVARSDLELVRNSESREIEELKAKGMIVNQANRKAFQQALEPLYEEYAQKNGQEWRDLVAAIMAL